MTATIGVDVGGTWTDAVVVSETCEVIAANRVPTLLPGGEAVVATIAAAIGGLLHHPPAPVGIGIPGQVDVENGSVRLAVNLGIDERPFPLADEVAVLTGTPVTVENDVRAAALGVYRSLTATGEDPGDLALLSIGTGIAAGVVLGGAIHRGANGMAGEIGHVVVDRDGLPCRCGQRGCLETVAAGPAIAAAYPAASPAEAASTLFRDAAAGDATARLLAARVVSYLTSAIHWLVAAYDVRTVFLGGGVTAGGDYLLELVHQAMHSISEGSSLAAGTLNPERIRLAPSVPHLGAMGAAAVASRPPVASSDSLALTTDTTPTMGGDR
jgi:glucokinase